MLDGDVSRSGRVLALGAAGFGLAAFLATVDPFLEGEAWSVRGWWVDVFDKGLLVGVMIATALIVVRITRLEEETATIRADLGDAQRQSEDWRRRSRELIDGLSGAIEAQFESWSLTPAESDIAGLLLKGASVRDIAVLRRTSQATIRQQAQSVYRKSGLSNRAELSAYFLDDLFSRFEAEGAGDPEAAPSDRLLPDTPRLAPARTH